jgi:hypothetical protein
VGRTKPQPAQGNGGTLSKPGLPPTRLEREDSYGQLQVLLFILHPALDGGIGISGAQLSCLGTPHPSPLILRSDMFALASVQGKCSSKTRTFSGFLLERAVDLTGSGQCHL